MVCRVFDIGADFKAQVSCIYRSICVQTRLLMSVKVGHIVKRHCVVLLGRIAIPWELYNVHDE